MFKNIFIFSLLSILLISTTVSLKISNIQLASDGGVILSAEPGYAWDPNCNLPHYYVPNYLDIYTVATWVRPCRGSLSINYPGWEGYDDN